MSAVGAGSPDRVLAALGEVVEAARGRRQPPEAEHAAKRMIMDAIGCAFGAFGADVPVIARELAAARPLGGGCAVLGTGLRTAPELAAFANAVMVRYLDYNDSYGSAGGIGHPSDYIPAALAAAERSCSSGPELLAAVALVYEVFGRVQDTLRLGVQTWDHVTAGAVASAAAAALLGGLSPQAVRHAMSIAVTAGFATQATRLGALSMWKGCAAGNAARHGVFAAELAGRGMTGPAAPFEGRGGVFAATGVTPDMSGLVRERPVILDTHIKRYPCGYFSQGAVEAALEARNGLRTSGPVVAIEVRTFGFGKRVMAGDPEKWAPATRETADHSIPFVVASAVANGEVEFGELADPEIVRLLSVLTVQEDPECEAAWPQACLNKVALVLRDGSRREAVVRYYRGHARNPMSDDELRAKFARQVAPVLGEAGEERLATAIWALDQGGEPSDVVRAGAG